MTRTAVDDNIHSEHIEVWAEVLKWREQHSKTAERRDTSSQSSKPFQTPDFADCHGVTQGFMFDNVRAPV